MKNIKRVYNAADIARMFAVSTNATRDFLDEARINQLFPVIKVGTQYVVPADAFNEWNIYPKPKDTAENADVILQGTKGDASVYTPSDIQRILAISKTKTYDFLAQVYAEKEPFLVIRCGKNYRIGKASFDQWFWKGFSK